MKNKPLKHVLQRMKSELSDDIAILQKKKQQHFQAINAIESAIERKEKRCLTCA